MEFADRELDPIEGFWGSSGQYGEGEDVLYRTQPEQNNGYLYAERTVVERVLVASPRPPTGTRITARWNPTRAPREYRGEMLMFKRNKLFWSPARFRLLDAVTAQYEILMTGPVLGGSIQRVHCTGPAEILAKRRAAIASGKSRPSETPGAGSYPKSASGSGFLVAPDLVVTNWHVVEDADSITCIIARTECAATLLTHDRSNDLALLRVDGAAALTNRRFALGDAASVRRGQTVFGFGYPLTGQLGGDVGVLTGIVSNLTGFQGSSSEFQVQMAINPGNSGGPLIDDKGHVIAILTSKLGLGVFLETGIIPEGVAFAVKADMIRPLVASAGRTASLLEPTDDAASKSLEELADELAPAVVRVKARTDRN